MNIKPIDLWSKCVCLLHEIIILSSQVILIIMDICFLGCFAYS